MSTLRDIWCAHRIYIWSLMVLTIDWVTKQIATDSLPYGISQYVNPIFNWTLVHNQGAAFSFLASQPGWQRWGLSVVAILAIIIFYHWARRLEPCRIWQRFAIALIIGGALGNLIDRLRYGYVIDCIDVHWAQYHWPAFNVADSAICIGIMVLLIALWTSRTPKSS